MKRMRPAAFLMAAVMAWGCAPPGNAQTAEEMSLVELQDAVAGIVENNTFRIEIGYTDSVYFGLLDMDFDGIPEVISGEREGGQYVYSLTPRVEYRGWYAGEPPDICFMDGKKIVAGGGKQFFLTEGQFCGTALADDNLQVLERPVSGALDVSAVERQRRQHPAEDPAEWDVSSLDGQLRALARAYWNSRGGKLEADPASAPVLPAWDEPEGIPLREVPVIGLEDLRGRLAAFADAGGPALHAPDYENSEIVQVELMDLDLDGIPELLWNCNETMWTGNTQIYSLKDGVRYLGEYQGALPAMYCKGDRAIYGIRFGGGGSAFGVNTDALLKLTAGGPVTEPLFAQQYSKDYSRLALMMSYYAQGRFLFSPVQQSGEEYAALQKAFYERWVMVDEPAMIRVRYQGLLGLGDWPDDSGVMDDGVMTRQELDRVLDELAKAYIEKTPRAAEFVPPPDGKGYRYGNGVLTLEKPYGMRMWQTDASVPKDQVRLAIMADGVTVVCRNTFSGCKNLRAVLLPETVRGIDDAAFRDCGSLLFVNLPDTVERIGASAFQGCRSLRLSWLPKSVKTVGESAFEDCASMKSIVLPEGLEALGKHAFKGCKALKKADFPDSLKKIGEGVFAESGLDI